MKKNKQLKYVYGKMVVVWLSTVVLLCLFWCFCGNFVQELINEIQYQLFRETGGDLFFYVVVIFSSLVPVVVLCLLSLPKKSFVCSALKVSDAIANLVEHKEVSIQDYEDAVFYEELQKLVQIHEIMEENTKKALVNERLKMELLTNVSHDLKTPLTSLMGN